MTQSDSIAELLSALAEVQGELPTMPKSSQAYGYKYTDLDTITQTIKPILSKHGIGFMQSVGGPAEKELALTTRIFNKKGEYIEDTAALPAITGTKNNAAQTLGMSITYMRRYALCAMLGITSDEDVDANTDGTAQPKESQQKPTPPKQAARPKQPAKAQFTPKGGESTPKEKARIKELCGAKYTNGMSVFTLDEIRLYSSYRKDKTAAELIAFIENALRNRRADAPELTPAEPTPPAQPSAGDLAGQALTEAQQPSFDDMQPVEQSEQGIDIF